MDTNHPKRAFVFYGGWDGHAPAAFAEIARADLEALGFEVTQAASLEPLADAPTMASYDLIVPLWTMGELTEAQERGLVGAVEHGTGLAGWHGGMGDAFRGSPRYQFMVGGQFVAHPGNVIDYRVRIARREGLLEGLDDFDIRSEQYYLHVDPCNEVWATTSFGGEHASWVEGCVMPVVWTRRHGRGRVFYSSLGHAPAEFDIPEVREIVRRGMRWACR